MAKKHLSHNEMLPVVEMLVVSTTQPEVVSQLETSQSVIGRFWQHSVRKEHLLSGKKVNEI